MIRTIIVDDERLARKELTSLLKGFSQIEVIGEASNVNEAISLIEAHKPDLVFCDIQMPEKSGFDLIEELNYMPRIIFVTAFDEYAIKAFGVNALDYLLKPVEKIRLEQSIAKVEKQIEEEKNAEAPTTVNNDAVLDLNDNIFLKDGDKCWFVNLTEVRMFESEGNYVRVYFQNSKPLILRSLNSLENRLSDKYFFRASRKFIINLQWIAKVESWFSGGLIAELKSGEKVEISRRQAVKFKEQLSL
jgi:two-component system LytT family response regulator